MKKLLNTSLFLAVFILLFSSLGCEKKSSYTETGMDRTALAEENFTAQTTHRVVVAPSTTPAPVVVERPAPKQAFPSESTDLVISRIYPAPEFAIIQMDKTMPEEVELNKPFDYSIKVKNLTNATLTNVVITEDVPKNFKYTSSKPVAKESETELVWEIESLEPRESRTISVTGLAIDEDSMQISTSVVTHFVPASVNIKVIRPKLELAVAAPEGAILCDIIPVRFTVTNAGTGSARNIRVFSALPEGLQTADCDDEITIEAGTLTAGQSRKYLAKLKATKTGKYTTKTVATATNLKAESQENTIVIGQPVLVINKTGPEQLFAGKIASYTITVANKGDAPSKNTIVEDIIPEGVNSIKATAGAKMTHSKKVIWNLGTLAPNDSKKMGIAYVPIQMGELVNKTTASAYCAETVTSSVTTSVAGISAVSLEVIDTEDPVEVGGSTTYVIQVVNQGSAPGTGIGIVCNLEDNVRYVSSSGATSGSIEGNVLRFDTLDTLAPKAKAVWKVTIQAMEPADTRFKVTMNSDQLSRPVEETEATHLYK